MKHMLTLAALALGTAAFSQSFFDDFNRADGDPGPNWVNIDLPAMTIMSNEITGAGTGNGLSLVDNAVFTGPFETTVVQADLRITDNSSTLAYAALAIAHNGVITSGNGIFVKLQRQTVVTNNFTHIGIYTGNGINNSTAITTTGGNFQALASPFNAARLTLRANSPTELYTGIDTDFNGTDEFSYTSTLNASLVLGNRVGMHFWGNLSRGDNFNANVVPEPATIAVLGLGALGLLLRRRK